MHIFIEENGRIREVTAMVIKMVAEDIANMEMSEHFLASVNLSTNDLNAHHIRKTYWLPLRKRELHRKKLDSR